MFTLIGIVAVAVFCIALAVREARRKSYVWAVLAFAAQAADARSTAAVDRGDDCA